MARKKGNSYVIDRENNIAKIELRRKNGENFWTVIDLYDLNRVLEYPYTWYAKYQYLNKGYYVYASEYIPEKQRCRSIFLHQFIVNANGKTVDHINGDTFDNRKSNLRIVEYSNNSKNNPYFMNNTQNNNQSVERL